MKSDRLDLIPGPYLIHPACGVIELRQGAELPLAERTLPHWWNQMSDDAQDIAFEEWWNAVVSWISGQDPSTIRLENADKQGGEFLAETLKLREQGGNTYEGRWSLDSARLLAKANPSRMAIFRDVDPLLYLYETWDGVTVYSDPSAALSSGNLRRLSDGTVG